MTKRYHRLLIILILSSLLTGCWDYQDVNKRNIRLSVGLDKTEDGFDFNGESASLIAGAEKSGEKIQIPVTYYYTASGRSLEEVKEKLDESAPQEDFSGAMRVVVLGKNYAEDGIEPYINRVNHLTYLRKSLLIVVSREAPKQLFQRQVTNDISIGYAIEDTIRQLNENGQCIYKTAQDVQTDIQNKDIGYILPYVGIENNTIEFLGFVIMKENKMIGIISNEKSFGFLYLLLNKATDMKTISDVGNKENIYSVRTKLKKRKIKTNYNDKKINIDIDLKLVLQLQYQYQTKALNEGIIRELKDKVAKEVEKEVLYAVNLSQKEYKSDVFGFAKYFKAQNPKAYKEINWKEEYPKATINLNIETKFSDVNLININNKKEQ
ncbi:Ger(x)C family spore germination protein [Clostridium sp. JNZ J1-5]